MAGAANCLSFRVSIFREAVSTYDVPGAIVRQPADPFGVACAWLEPLPQVNDLLDVVLKLRQLTYRARNMRRQVVVEEELQAASFSSYRTAASTSRGAMSKILAT